MARLPGRHTWVTALIAGGLLACLCSASPAAGQVYPLPKASSVRSSSGQFVAAAPGVLNSAPRVLNVSTNKAFMRLDPALVSVSAERLKQLLWRELEVQGQWHGRVFLWIRSCRTTNDAVVLTSEKSKDGWRYGLDLPEVVDRRRYVRALTKCVLLEMANRGAERSAELPPWLVEGLAAQVLAFHETEIILSAATHRNSEKELAATVVSVYREHPLREAQRRLGTNANLTFQQLSWPSSADFDGASAESYRLNSQVFVAELMQLRGGRTALRDTLFNMPRYYNWQFAFLQAFQPWFSRPLDVEKWWSLNLSHLSGRQLAEAWSTEKTWLEFEDLLGAAVEVRSKPDELPQIGRVTLQEVLRDWDPTQRVSTVRERLAQLDLLALRSAPELRGLIMAYRQVLHQYLEKANRIKPEKFLKNSSADHRPASQAIESLGMLDLQRHALRGTPGAQASAGTASLPAPPGP